MLAKTVIKLAKVEQHPFSEDESGIKLAHNIFFIEYSGDLIADGILHELWIKYPDGSADIYGIERVTGYLVSKKGSFAAEHRGRFEDGIIKKNISIIKNSGTGELIGIAGGTHLEWVLADEFPIYYDYNLPKVGSEEPCN